jgi:hypothetical protein
LVLPLFLPYICKHLSLKLKLIAMKKFILLIVSFVFLITGAMAQTSFKTDAGATSVTLTNVDTDYLTINYTFVANKTIGIIAYADTLTGSDATVTVQLEVWISDDTGWGSVGTATTMITTGGVAEKAVALSYTDTYFRRYRLAFTQTGAATTTVSGQAYFRSK